VRLFALAVTLLNLTVLNGRASAQDAQTDSVARDEAHVFRSLQRAIAANDRSSAAALFVYPFRVNRSASSHFAVRTKAELLKSFDKILPDTVRRAIIKQNPDSLFHNWQGSMVGNGAIWIAGVCRDQAATRCKYGVTVVNLPIVNRRASGRSSRRAPANERCASRAIFGCSPRSFLFDSHAA
jgi:hypothetical protein